MNYVQATRTLLVFPRNNQGTECTHFNSSRSSLLRKCRPVLSVPPFGQDGTRRSLGCSGEFPKRMEGPVLSGAAWVYKRVFRPFCISALGAFFRWEKDFGLARRPTAPAGYSYFSPRRASPAPPSAGGPGLPRLWSVRPVALPPGPQANARGRLPSTSWSFSLGLAVPLQALGRSRLCRDRQLVLEGWIGSLLRGGRCISQPSGTVLQKLRARVRASLTSFCAVGKLRRVGIKPLTFSLPHPFPLSA